MRSCSECSAAVSEAAAVCSACGAELAGGVSPGADPDAAVRHADPDAAVTNADLGTESERERFRRRYGIDIGDRTVEEFLEHLGQQDYTLTGWFWLIVAAESVGFVLFGVALFGPVELGTVLSAAILLTSVLMTVAIFTDTRLVGLFRPWAKIRWTYVLLAVIPFVGHIAGAIYLLLRRFRRERAVDRRRRLLEAGVDVPHYSEGD